MTWWFAIVLENPNADYVFDTYLDVEALGPTDRPGQR